MAVNSSNITIRQLTNTNYIQREDAVLAYAVPKNVLSFVQGAVATAPANTTPEQRAAHTKRHMLGRNLMKSTISNDFLDDIGRHALRREPHEIFQAVTQHVAKDECMDYHDVLSSRARQMKIKQDETIEDFARRRKKLRQEMIEAKYPHAEDERLTIRHIIKGLSANDQLALHIPMLLTHKYYTIKELLSSMTILLDEATIADSTKHIQGTEPLVS